MSSTYQALCLNHDPALVIESDWHRPETALAAVADRTGDLADHALCDLMIGRYSYPLIEICCPPHDQHPHTAKWVDASWVRIAVAALDSEDPRTVNALARLDRCWTVDRLRRLRPHLDLDR